MLSGKALENVGDSKDVKNAKNLRKFFNGFKSAMHFGRSIELGQKLMYFNSFKHFIQGDCIPIKESTKVRRTVAEPPVKNASIESIDGMPFIIQPDKSATQRKIRDLEEQVKLIPLLQIQIQVLRDERQHLQSQLESRASSTLSSSPHPQPVFQAHRVSPVSLNSIKTTPVIPKRNNRSTGTNTSLVLRRDVGCSPEGAEKRVHRGMSTDFIMKIDGDGGRLYTESDLKKAIEMAHAKMRKTTATVGTQFGENEREKYCDMFDKMY